MRLKKLILHGFKSFADRTEFVFDAPITGIVGPNGCGKSNVVDGFKWVLGEQSAKSLRGEAMLDVIFNGSGGRKPAGMAEVTLVFENPRRDDDGTRTLNLDYDEVSVGRRLYRDGTSEYQINNQSSRLKDVRELFLDTGVGVDAYSVIEQGRVSALLEANPEERRLIFEEAAGISKFKQRKKEAVRKLEKVDQNLLRLNDIVEEVEKRLRSVKIQAGRARTFKEHNDRLVELRLGYALQEYHAHHGQLADLQCQREDAVFRLEDASADLTKASADLAEKREAFEKLSGQKQATEYELVQAKAAMQAAKQRQDYAERELRQIAEQVEAFARDQADAESKLAELLASLAAESETLARLTSEVETGRRQIDEKQRAFRDGQLRHNVISQDVEQHKGAILDLMRKLALTNSRLGAIEIERKNIAAQQSRIADRRRVVVGEIATVDAQKAATRTKLDDAVAQIAEHQSKLEACRAESANLGKQIAQLSENLGAAKEHRSGLNSRQKLLKDLEAKREGVSEGVKSVLRQRDDTFTFVRGLVADVLRVDIEHAHVIEAALDGRDQWLVATDADAAVAAREAFDDLEGRVNFLSGTGYQPVSSDESEEEHGLVAHATAYDWNQHPQKIRLAVDLVRFETPDAPIAEHLLGTTVIVDTLTDAVELHRTGPAGYRYVTQAGEVIEADGTLRAGPLTAAMGLLSRHAELAAIAQQIADVDARIEQLTAQVTEGNATARELQEQENALRNDVYKANTAKVELTSQIAQADDRLAALNREQPLLERELAAFLDQTGRLKTEELTLAEKRQAMDADQASRQQKVEELTGSHHQLAEELRQTGEQLTAERVSLGQIQEKQLASQQHVQRQTAAKAELAQQVERIARSAEAVVNRRAGVEREMEGAKAAEAQLLAKQQALAGQIESLVARVQEVGNSVQGLTERVEELRAEHAAVEQALHGVELKTGELKVRLETLVQRTLDELQLDLPHRYASLSENEGSGYQPGDVDWDAVAEEIKDLREKIHRLGNVNLDAIAEQDELEQREQFLSTQLNDLTESKRQLEQLIDEINVESGLRFEQTFNAVREHFQGMFRKLFGGGKADVYLELEVEEKGSGVRGQGSDASSLSPDSRPLTPVMRKVDILDAGIEIMAHPPGKKPATISQLSGGEKTMTCIALLMSIFKSKPSPFCILDEVDAALDEANNGRFNLIVEEFVEQSQFIVITHSKRTMQIANLLYGVTMQEQGVSKKVAVKFDQVEADGRIKETAAA